MPSSVKNAVVKSEGYWICLHPDHKTVLELIADSKLEKFQRQEGGYILLCHREDRDKALKEIQVMLMKAYHEDPDMKRVKAVLLTLYRKPSA